MKRQRQGGRLVLQKTAMNEGDYDKLLFDAGVPYEVLKEMTFEEKKSNCSDILRRDNDLRDKDSKSKEMITSKPRKQDKHFSSDDKDVNSEPPVVAGKRTRAHLTLHAKRNDQEIELDGRPSDKILDLTEDCTMETRKSDNLSKKLKGKKKAPSNKKANGQKKNLKFDDEAQQRMDNYTHIILAPNTQRSPDGQSSPLPSPEEIIVPESDVASSPEGSDVAALSSPPKIIHEMWPPRFCPPGVRDPSAYTEVIKLMFDIYLRRLRTAKRQTHGKEKWGQPVCCGPTINNTLRKDPAADEKELGSINTEGRPRRYSTRGTNPGLLNSADGNDASGEEECEVKVTNTRRRRGRKEEAYSRSGGWFDDEQEEGIGNNTPPDFNADIELIESDNTNDSDFIPHQSQEKKKQKTEKRKTKRRASPAPRKKMKEASSHSQVFLGESDGSKNDDVGSQENKIKRITVEAIVHNEDRCSEMVILRSNTGRRKLEQRPFTRKMKDKDHDWREQDEEDIDRRTNISPDLKYKPKIMEWESLHDSESENEGHDQPPNCLEKATHFSNREPSKDYTQRECRKRQVVFDIPSLIDDDNRTLSSKSHETRGKSVVFNQRRMKGEAATDKSMSSKWLSKKTYEPSEDNTIGSENNRTTSSKIPAKKRRINSRDFFDFDMADPTKALNDGDESSSEKGTVRVLTPDIPEGSVAVSLSEKSSHKKKEKGNRDLETLIEIDSSPEDMQNSRNLNLRVDAVESEAGPSSQSSGFLLDTNGDMYSTQIKRSRSERYLATNEATGLDHDGISRKDLPPSDKPTLKTGGNSQIAKRMSKRGENVIIDHGKKSANAEMTKLRSRKKLTVKEVNFELFSDDVTSVLDGGEGGERFSVEDTLDPREIERNEVQSSDELEEISFVEKSTTKEITKSPDEEKGNLSKINRAIRKELEQIDEESGKEITDESDDRGVEKSPEKGICPICREEFPTRDLEVHASTCSNFFVEQGNKTECMVCKIEFDIDMLKTHQAACLERQQAFEDEVVGQRETRNRTKTKPVTTARRGGGRRGRQTQVLPNESPTSNGEEYGELYIEFDCKK